MGAVRVMKLSRVFSSRLVLKDLSFEATPGQKLMFRGANGSGKTTLFRVLATLIEPSQGEASVGGFSVVDQKSEVRSCVGWVPATDGGMIQRLTGRENLDFFAGLRGLDASTTKRVLNDLRDFEPLASALDTPFYICSAGMKHALLVARALLHGPSVLILDEPLRSLDSATTAKLQALICQGLPKTTVLFSCHGDENWPGARRFIFESGGVREL